MHNMILLLEALEWRLYPFIVPVRRVPDVFDKKNRVSW